MSILIEESEEVCSHCMQLRKTFIHIACSAVLPILVFAFILILVSSGRYDVELETPTTLIAEFTFGILYLQLFVATSVLIVSFVKRKQPILKYHVWYLIFHILIVFLLLCACVALTFVNEAYFLTSSVVAGTVAYYSFIYRCLKTDKYPWTALRRAY